MFLSRAFSAVRILAAAALVAVAIPAGVVAAGAGTGGQAAAAVPTPVQVYGAWHCGNDYCTWGTVRDAAPGGDFDKANHWLIDRDPGPALGSPSINVVVLSFVNPLKLLNGTTDATTLNGVPRGMSAEIVNYFTSRKRPGDAVNRRDHVHGRLGPSPRRRTLPSWASTPPHVAAELGVGIEIDYEQNTTPNLTGLQAFIDAYRFVAPLRPVRRQPRGAADHRPGGR